MPLDIVLTLDKTTVIAQEDLLCRYALTNSDNRPLSILTPALTERVPIVRIIDVDTGVENRYSKRSSSWSPESLTPLEPAGSLQAEFSLLSRVPALPPSECELSLLYPYDDGNRIAESNAVRVHVLPATPKNLTLDDVRRRAVYGFWVNAAASPPELVRSCFYVMADGGVGAVQRLARVGLRTRAVASQSANRSGGEGHWVTWIEGPSLRFLHVSSELGPSSVGEHPLSGEDHEIVAPPYRGPIRNTLQRPEGALFLRSGSAMSLFSLGAERRCLVVTREIEGPRPSWMSSFARSDGSRRLLLLQASDDRMVLYGAAWSDGAIDRPGRLTEWPGSFVAAAGTLDLGDTFQGAFLRWTEAPESSPLEIVQWTLDSKDGVVETGRREVAWDTRRTLAHAALRVSSAGFPAALLTDDEGAHSFAGESLLRLPTPLAKSELPLDIAFLGDRKPVLIAAEERTGLKLLQPDGSPIPRRP